MVHHDISLKFIILSLSLTLSETTLFAMLTVLGTSKQGLVAWFNWDPIYETNFHTLMRNEPAIVKRFYKQLLMYTQAGIPHKVKGYMKENSYLFFTLNTVYRNLQEFTSDNSKFDQLVVDNFRTIFVFYALFCFGILLICLFKNWFFERYLKPNVRRFAWRFCSFCFKIPKSCEKPVKGLVRAVGRLFVICRRLFKSCKIPKNVTDSSDRED